MMSSTESNNLSVLPPILTDGTGNPNPKDRLSTYSNLSLASQNRSRPGSHVFPIFHTSLPYALVRDFAYPSTHPLHYGPPPPRASGVSTPASESRRLSDPPPSWDTRGSWAPQPSSEPSHANVQQLPAMSFGDGPPYSEDEDLHSPVVTSRHRKKSSDLNGLVDERVMSGTGNDRGMLVGINADGSETYYVNEGDTADDGPGGEYVTYPANEGRYSIMGYSGPGGQAFDHDPGFESEDEIPGVNRYSRDYQFAVGCPDEEMHGKAVALFDFTREHENELPLTEGQVIYVSYRHGQGWLVAEDPKTGENGLVPEEFVRLLRDIEGGLTSLNGDSNPDTTGIADMSSDSHESDQLPTPTQTERPSFDEESNKPTNGASNSKTTPKAESETTKT
ncbi:unnamed protein product [Penicillium olsonii]|uniref:SH3 domain-containing protein n=1 Tax=Penicillium olsonii TaxID=99116 RepID=A0A9W4MYA9_PENOL|nr:unnamed protein product [Penicillium olsonii]CAG7931911.1 unnamed protein product [Penicillium olsonii]CAG8059498.1 unnamed protein product [Penicillium olsonii]CAG8115796.1 unnamed protein product [Penicillium olsonii]CAG8165148.1 unnamed protein product [Penicillium olsonii]